MFLPYVCKKYAYTTARERISRNKNRKNKEKRRKMFRMNSNFFNIFYFFFVGWFQLKIKINIFFTTTVYRDAHSFKKRNVPPLTLCGAQGLKKCISSHTVLHSCFCIVPALIDFTQLIQNVPCEFHSSAFYAHFRLSSGSVSILLYSSMLHILSGQKISSICLGHLRILTGTPFLKKIPILTIIQVIFVYF